MDVFSQSWVAGHDEMVSPVCSTTPSPVPKVMVAGCQCAALTLRAGVVLSAKR
jgi:hypothetical protein